MREPKNQMLGTMEPPLMQLSVNCFISTGSNTHFMIASRKNGGVTKGVFPKDLLPTPPQKKNPDVLKLDQIWRFHQKRQILSASRTF